MSIQGLTEQFVAPTYSRFPLAIQRGEGSLLRDKKGKEYIDFGAGIAVNTLGQADPGLRKVVRKQLARMGHASNLYYTKPAANLAKNLCERTGAKKVFFSNSGAEANECMVKCARKWSHDRTGSEARSGIVTLEGSFHGRTIAMLAATGQEQFHRDFGPFPGGFFHTKPNDFEALEQLLKENDGKICAILLELVLGEGGVIALDPEFVKGVSVLAQKHDLLLLLDEVQTGNGRTGTLFAYEQYEIFPDIVSTAKGLAGGLPLGATIFFEKTAEVLQPGSHGSTFGGNPLCTAAGNYVLSQIDNKFLEHVRNCSQIAQKKLKEMEGVQGISGMGLMLGVETCRPAREVAEACLEAGLLVLTAKEKIRLLPPLNIPVGILEEGLTLFSRVIAKN